MRAFSTGGVHGPELRRVNTGHGTAELSIFEDGVPPRFRFTGRAVSWVRAETLREGGARQGFTFANRGLFWESVEEITGPHGFHVCLVLGHGAHDHAFQVEFVEHAHDNGHEHRHHGHNHNDHEHEHEDEGADNALYAPLASGAAVLARHAHPHHHGAAVHAHWHDHAADSAHEIAPNIDAAPPAHIHTHKTSARTALLLILGSSPIVEGIPAFFAACRFGIILIAIMVIVFAASTMVTYVALCIYSAAGLQRVKMGPLERYGEVISGLFIAAVGVVFLLWRLDWSLSAAEQIADPWRRWYRSQTFNARQNTCSGVGPV